MAAHRPWEERRLRNGANWCDVEMARTYETKTELRRRPALSAAHVAALIRMRPELEDRAPFRVCASCVRSLETQDPLAEPPAFPSPRAVAPRSVPRQGRTNRSGAQLAAVGYSVSELCHTDVLWALQWLLEDPSFGTRVRDDVAAQRELDWIALLPPPSALVFLHVVGRVVGAQPISEPGAWALQRELVRWLLLPNRPPFFGTCTLQNDADAVPWLETVMRVQPASGRQSRIALWSADFFQCGPAVFDVELSRNVALLRARLSALLAIPPARIWIGNPITCTPLQDEDTTLPFVHARYTR